VETSIPKARGLLDTNAQPQNKTEGVKLAARAGTSQSRLSRIKSTEPDFYRGWYITYDPTRPVTGTWHAERFGVGMGNNSKESLVRMIDTKIKEQQK